MYQALAQNTKIYFGDSIPNIFATDIKSDDQPQKHEVNLKQPNKTNT